MNELFTFICQYCAHGKYAVDVMSEMTKANPYMLDNAKKDIDLLAKLKKPLIDCDLKTVDLKGLVTIVVKGKQLIEQRENENDNEDEEGC